MKIIPAAVLAICLSWPAAAQDSGQAMSDMMRSAIAAARAAPAAKSLSVRLDGKVKEPASLSLAQLKALPAMMVQTNFIDQGKASWKGASLMAILDKAGTADDEGPGAYLQHLIVARGADGYVAGIAIGEIDAKFEGKTAIIAYEKDGVPLDSLRLIVPGDRHAGRAVRNLAEITVN